jgi:hypothetical protein
MSDDFPGAKPPTKEPKNDVSDRVKNGGHLALVRDVKGAEMVREGNGFQLGAARVWTEHEERMAVARRGHLEFGVPFIGDALGSVMANDLILLGAETGGGKTELARYIAMHNASLGKRVHFLALEADKSEIERRTKWGFLLEFLETRCYAARKRSLNYLDWIEGRLDDIAAPFEKAASEITQRHLGKMQSFYRVKDFTITHLEKVFDEIAAETDMLVLDHIHFVDHEGANENQAQQFIVKKLRDLQQKHAKAVIVVAHLRKGDGRSERLIPTKDDFMGTKQISGISTKAIMLAPAYDQPLHEQRHRWKTYIAPLKCRVDGSRSRYVGLCTFDARKNKYEKKYQLGRVIDRGTKFVALTNRELPDWAPEDACEDLE